MKLLRDKRQTIWNEIVEHLTLSQLEKCMFITWYEKADAVKRVSKSRKVHTLADALIAECQRIAREFTWFKGLPYEKTTLVKELIHAHVVATQEYDHEGVDEIEEYLFELKMAPTREELYLNKAVSNE